MNAFDYFFEHTAQLDKLFLVGKEEVSFRDLHRTCSNIASWLQNKIGQNKHVILLSVNNLFFLKAYLAIIKSGNICIPLDPGIESDNYKYISNLTSPEMIFVTRDVERKLKLNSEKSVFPDTLPFSETLKPWNLGAPAEIPYSGTETSERQRRSRTAGLKPWNPETLKPWNSESCAEIIFTSGSTGKPKGVMISHKNLISNTSSIVEYLKLTADDRMLVVLPLYYCYGLSLLHTHLRAGGSIIFNNSFIFLGKVISNLLDYKCSGFAGVPSHFQILLRKSDSFKTTKFPDLKYVTQAGGKLAPIFIDEFREAHPDIKFIVMYGQTEATARLSWLPPELYERKRGSIGKGIPGVELRVVNEKGEKIMDGDTGEVTARGGNIMMGYFFDEEGTKNAIRNGWLYTGDLGTVDKEGYIYLTARKKEIIKVRGKRISPKEIEAVILEIPGTIDVTITCIEDDTEGEALKATVVVRNEVKVSITSDMIYRYCSRHLALYKVPRFIEIIDNITISATGKKINGRN